MAEYEVRIPDIGDAEGVEVIEIAVTPGAAVEVDDLLIVIESDKASMEIPAPVAGTVLRVELAVGDSVHEGQLVVVLDAEEAATGDQPGKAGGEAVREAPVEKPEAPRVEPERVAEPERTAEPEAPRQVQEPAARSRLEVTMPDTGEAEDVVVIEVAVAPGDEVAAGDLLVVVESDKASMEIPAPASGTVTEVAVTEGDGVVEGTLLVVLSAAAGADLGGKTQAPPVTAEPRPAGQTSPPSPAEPAATPETPAMPAKGVHAGPAVRRMARELGVDLEEVKGTGSRGRIVKEDVDSYVRRALKGRPPAQVQGPGIPPVPTVDFARFGPVEEVAMSRIRIRGAANLTRSWLNVPHVTQHDEADVTDLEAFRTGLKAEADARGVKLTPLAFIMKAVVATLQAFPMVNASLGPNAETMILKRYHHIGFAVDTEDGLVVPVVRNADGKGVYQLAAEISDLSERARAGKLAIDELSGASFTISSLGPIGGTAFTPIVNAPEVGILGVSRLTVKPHWNGETFEPRKLLPLSLSYDHRAINGAEAGRFMVHLCSVLGDMRRVLL